MYTRSIPRTLINGILACTCALASTAVFASATTINASYGTGGVSAPSPAPSYSIGNAADHNDSAHGAYSLINAADTHNGGTPGVYSIVRRTATGALDTNFGVGGIIGSFPNNSGTGIYQWSTLCIDPSTHYIVVTGNDGNGHFVAERLVPQSTSATLDPTFNPSGAVPGVVVTPQLSLGGGNPHGCLVAGDGTIFVAGSSGTGNNNITTAGVIVVAKINSDGSMAGTFGVGGMASIAVTDGSGNPLIPEVGNIDFNSDQSVNNDLIIAGDTYAPNTDGSITSPLVMAVQRCDGTLDTSFNGTGTYLNASFDSATFNQSVYVRVLSTGYISLLYINVGQNPPPFAADIVTIPFPFSGSGVTTAGATTITFPTGVNPRGGVATNSDGTFVIGGNNSSTQEVLTEFDGDPSFGFTVGIPATLASCPAGTPGISASPASLSFGNQVGGTTSAAQSITVKNTGTAALTVSGVTLTGANTPAFAIASNSCSAVQPGGTCAIGVVFHPPGAGAKSASVSIASNGSGSPTTVALSGTGVTGPLVSLSPTSLSFGSQAGGTTSAAQTITVHNTGTTSLSVSGATLTGANTVAFSIASNSCTAVAAGGFCNIGVTFNPPGSGAKSASLSIASNAPGSPTLVGLSGTGVAGGPAISVTPTSLSFGSQAGGTTSAAQTITVHNTGTTTLSAIGWQLTGANTVAFSIASNSCSVPLAAGATCTIGVTFNPPGAGAKSASVSITSSVGTLTVSLSGTGT